MIVAELVLRHTRHSSPTRRVAVERFVHPTDSAIFAPGVLLAGVAATHLPWVEEVLADRFDALVAGLARGVPMPPRALRYRVQTDRVGLDRSEHRLIMSGERPALELDEHGPSLPQVVGALAALAGLRGQRRRTAVALMRRARGLGRLASPDVVEVLLAGADPEVLKIRHRKGVNDEEEQALQVLGFGIWERPTRSQVITAFRRLVRDAHPDHGGESVGAGERVTRLAAARHVLLGGGEG